jgi:hypothetical protein
VFEDFEKPQEEKPQEEKPKEEEKPQEEKSDKLLAMMRSQQMVDKFEKEDHFEKSFEIEADAISVESNEIQIIDVNDEEPFIQEEESEKIQVAEAPADSGVLIQQKAQELMEIIDFDLDKEEIPMEEEPPKLGSSMIDDADTARIVYIEKVSGFSYNQMLKDNLLELMNMGFIDFDKNLMLLEKNHNNLELVCSKILE